MRSSPGDTPIQERAGFVLGRSRLQGCIPASPWSHLWSHSCKFGGVRSGLPSLGSGGTGPNRTGLNRQPQNSKAREGQPSAGSNPAATAGFPWVGHALCHPPAIERDAREPSPQIENSDRAHWVDLTSGHFSGVARRHPRIHRDLGGLGRGTPPVGLCAHQVCNLSELICRATSKTVEVSGNSWPTQRPRCAVGTTQHLTTSDDFLGESEDAQPIDVIRGASQL
jgi:hypothetical protein